MRSPSAPSWPWELFCRSAPGGGCWDGTRGFRVSRSREMLHYLNTYEGRIKIFLALLVFFLASAITVNFYLLMMSRNAVREEMGQRIVVVAEAVRLELGLGENSLPGEPISGGEAPAGQARLARLAKEHDLAGVELLNPRGVVLASSLVGRVGVLEG